VQFTRDPQRAVRTGRNADGQPIQDKWGWLGAAKHRQRRSVRRITVERPGDEPIRVVTDLVDADAYPAADLLALYHQRWGIERVFQQVTEVFGLHGLIGSSPRGTVFQLAFGLVLYNIWQVVRAYVARGSHHRMAEVSTEKLFLDVQDQLIAWNVLTTPADTLRLIVPLDLKATCGRLRELLDRVWKEVWRKSPAQRREPSCHSGHRGHGSAHRLLQETHERKFKPGNHSAG